MVGIKNLLGGSSSSHQKACVLASNINMPCVFWNSSFLLINVDTLILSTDSPNGGVLLEYDLSMRRHVAWTVGCCFVSSVSSGAASSRCLLGRDGGCSRFCHFEGGPLQQPARRRACVSPGDLDGLQPVLNAASRLICNRRKYDRVTPLLTVRHVLHCLPVPFRIEYKLCLLVFLSLHG